MTTDTQEIEGSIPNSELIEALEAKLVALMMGLEIPNPEWWIKNQPPESFMALGAAVAGQAKRAMGL